ncbi:protein RBL [Aristolochia californica]|uniref:protein RBL n=1 Tax=Aristolochia californica TaxID=171875 RepID=UPI0035D78D3B
MNATIIDPLQGDFPEVIEEYLEHGIMKCIAFNRRGTLLAAGCADGSCVIWDFETRGIAKELRDSDRVAPITSVCWSRDGHHLLASATDKCLTLWNVSSGEKVARATLQQTTLHARLHPSSSDPSICLACPLSSAPILVDLNTGSTTVLPVSVSVAGPSTVSHSRNKFADGSPPFTPTAATFSKYGDLIYVGNSKGEILIMDYQNTHVYGMVSVPGGAVIKSMVFSRNGQYLLTNSNDRTIRVFENLLPSKGGVKALEEISQSLGSELEVVEKLKMVGSKCLVLSREFQDSVNRSHWKAPCFSGDGEWVVGALASKGEHKIYIWGKAGNLVKILEGPKEALTDLSWHPVHPIVVSVSLAGFVYIWAKDYTENWSAFAPDFKELEENEEYEEREDEFDMMPETEKVKEENINEDEEVDILAFDKDSAFSDSDLSQEELCFLPAIPSPDVPEQHEKCLGSSSKLEGSTRSESPLSEEAGQNDQEMNPGSSLFEAVGNSAAEEVATNGRVKRKRKPSEKGLELQAEKGRKPATMKKSSW